MATEQSQPSRTGLSIAVLVILGLAAGIALGLLLGWVVWPVEIVDTSISDLAPEYKDEYVLLVASAYVCDGNVEKAQVRLARLEVPNVNGWLSAQIDSYIAEGRDEADIQALAALAHALGVTSPRMLAYLATDTTQCPPTHHCRRLRRYPPTRPLPLPYRPPRRPPLCRRKRRNRPTAPPTDTPKPAPTNTPKPAGPTNTPKPPPPTNTPQPTSPPADPGPGQRGCWDLEKMPSSATAVAICRLG